MITYSLSCPKGHTFEDMFDSYDVFAAKLAKKQIACPDCGSKSVHKNLSAPSVGSQAAAPAPSCGASACGNGACAFNQG